MFSKIIISTLSSHVTLALGSYFESYPHLALEVGVFSIRGWLCHGSTFWISEPSFLSCTLTRQTLVLTQTKWKILGPSCFFFFFWPFPKVLSRPCHGLCSLCLKYHNKVTSRSTYEKINNGLHPLHRVVFQNAVADFYDLSVLQRQVKGPFKT
jgi:hypothetical protein